MPAQDRCADLLAYCLAKPGAWQDEPWEGDVVVKVGPHDKGRIFAFLGEGTSIGLKCGSRDEADELITRFPGDVSVMAYIGRHGWNSVRLGGAVPVEEVHELVDASYEEVVAKLPRAQRPSR